MNTIGIILAAGIGSRFGGEIPKQYLKLSGKEIISYSIDAFEKSEYIDDFIVVVNDENKVKEISKQYGCNVIIGGNTRNESFREALNYIHNNFKNCKKIIVNEAARPLITSEIIQDYVELLDTNSCVYSTKPITDSIETANGHYVDRNNYRLVMSPEGYDFRVIDKYFTSDSPTTFPGHTIPEGYAKYGYAKYTNNIKITYKNDIKLIENIINSDKSLKM